MTTLARRMPGSASKSRMAREVRTWTAVAMLLSVAACDGPPQQARNAILVSIDTLRADRLGCYGYERATSPALDALAASGVVFTTALTQAPWTLPAHATLLTGLLPHHHGVVAEVHRLSADVPTLASTLGEAGFATGAWVSSRLLGRRHGLERGFESLTEYVVGGGTMGAAITDEAIEWLGQQGERPFFLFLHYYDVHSPYQPEARFRELLVDEYAGPATGSNAQLLEVRAGERSWSAADVRHVSELYDAEIRQLDEQIARLLGALEELGLRRSTAIVVTSDHGEEFLEHGSVLHGRTFYEEMVRVPLIVAGPDIAPGSRREELAMLVDVAPTLLARLGLPPAPETDGIDLLAHPGATRAERLAFAAADWRNGPPDRRRMLRDGRWKLIVDRVEGERELYDLTTDPEERRNLAETRPDVADRLAEQLPRFFERRRDPEIAPPRTPADTKLLQELGYLEP